MEAAVAALRSRDASKQHRAVDAILRDARARVPRLHWAAEWVGAGALQVRIVRPALMGEPRNTVVILGTVQPQADKRQLCPSCKLTAQIRSRSIPAITACKRL